MSKRVAIFGSGLSAAYIYAACKDTGCTADFFTDRSLYDFPEYGQIILRWVPDSLRLQAHPIWLFALGDKSAYLKRMKRAPEDSTKTTFPVTGRVEELAYNPKEFMDKVWTGKEHATFGKFSDDEIENISKDYAHSFVTFPLQASKDPAKLVLYWCYTISDLELALPNMAIYNATQSVPWTRFTQYWSVMTWEYSHIEYPTAMPPAPGNGAVPRRVADIATGVSEFKSPYERVDLVGRWARWKKGAQAFEGYAQAAEILREIV